MTMVACIVLGTGIPTIPNYIITSSMAAPVLQGMGVPVLISHMFCFYFGIMADLTPPVALAALAASSIAKEKHTKIRSEEHTSELQSLMRISYAVFCLKKKKDRLTKPNTNIH